MALSSCRDQPSPSKVAFDSGSRFVLAHFKQNNIVFGVAYLYAPNWNPERIDFFVYCSDQIDPVVPTVICGDFNSVFDKSLDHHGVNVSDISRESSLTLSGLFHDCCVVDIWRSLHPTTTAFTWLKPDGILSSRINLIGCPHAWVHRVDSCEILPWPFSDHSAVTLRVSIPQPIPRGPGRWKLNTSILTDADFVASVKYFWSTWKLKKTCFDSLPTWWDRGKEKIKEYDNFYLHGHFEGVRHYFRDIKFLSQKELRKFQKQLYKFHLYKLHLQNQHLYHRHQKFHDFFCCL